MRRSKRRRVANPGATRPAILVRRKAIPAELTDAWLRATGSTNFNKLLFNGAEGNDRKRLSWNPNPRWLEATGLERALSELTHSHFPRATFRCQAWSVLCSLPGCSVQEPHTDYDPAVVRSSGNKGFSMICAMQDRTCLYFHGAPGPLELDAGDVVWFRGDVLHSGGD